MTTDEEMRVDDVLAKYRDGDEHGWVQEFAWLATNHGAQVAALAVDVLANGMREPITLGNDGRVWDGHHRLCVAVGLNIARVPVRRVR